MIKKYFLLISLLLSGCGTLDYQQIYLNKANVVGPLVNPPIFISDERNSITISPRFSFNSIDKLAGPANSSKYLTDTINYTANVNWDLPQYSAGLDIDLPISKSVSFFGSINYSSHHQFDLTGGSLGVGFKSVSKGSAIRFNLGGSLQQYQYDARSVVVSTITPFLGDQYIRVDFYHDFDKKSNLGYFANLTYNTVIPDFPLNFYCSLAWFSQTVLNYSPRNLENLNNSLIVSTDNQDVNVESSSNFLSLSPGIYIITNQLIRFVIGVNIVWNIGDFVPVSGPSTSNVFIMPMAKLDFMF